MAFNNKSWHSIKTHQLGIVYLKLACKATKIREPTWKKTHTSDNFSSCVLQFNRREERATGRCPRPVPSPARRGTASWPRLRAAAPRPGPRLLAARAPRHHAAFGRRGAAPLGRWPRRPRDSELGRGIGLSGGGKGVSGAWRGESMEDGRRCQGRGGRGGNLRRRRHLLPSARRPFRSSAAAAFVFREREQRGTRI